MYGYFYLLLLYVYRSTSDPPLSYSNETLRLQPAVPNSVQRRLPFESEGVMVADCFVPPGTTVQIPSYSSEHPLSR
jgi:hypothetical protein